MNDRRGCDNCRHAAKLQTSCRSCVAACNWEPRGQPDPAGPANAGMGDWNPRPDNKVASIKEIFDAVTAESGSGLKFDAGKAPMDLLDPYAMTQLANVLAFGARKYTAHNWRKGLPKSRLIAAALRHLFAYLDGQDKDPETGLSHAAHAMCCCMFLLGLEHRPELDDRWKPVGRRP